MRGCALAVLAPLTLAAAGTPSPPLPPSAYEVHPSALPLLKSMTPSQSRASLTKPRSFSSQEKAAGFPQPAPRTCQALLADWDRWIFRVASSAAGGKFAEVDYVTKAVDCELLRDMARYTPAATTLAAATHRLATGERLSGDFFPQLPDSKSTYKPMLQDQPSRVTFALAYKDGASPALPPNRTYTVLATATDLDGNELWLAREESVPGNYALCSYVRIAKSADDFLTIRDRIFLGRCA